MKQKYLLSTYKRQEVCFERGDNATLCDSEGKEYIDFAAGVAVCSVGHGNCRLARAISDQAAKILHVSNLYRIEPQEECARRIVELSGYDMRCFFGNSGTEANEGAIKIARKYGERDGSIKRYKIITLENSFHGRTITALKATGQASKHDYFGPYPDGFVYAANVEEIESLIDETTVAVMIELVQGEGGVQPLDKQKVQNLSALLKSKDILLIVDEVQTGIYRCGSFLASHYYGITPDVITLAKGLGGGVPIGVVMTRLKEIFSYGDHGSTFGGNYLSTVAANEVLDILEAYNKSGEMMEHQNYFETSLKSFALHYPDIFTERVGIGMMQGLRVIDSEVLSKIIDSAFEIGVLVIKSGRNTLRFVPPLTISKSEMDEGFRRLNSAMQHG
ncbi:acetylornithine aminotransferase apoenzyme (plasmid) [Sulfuricurvum kujiense DSM 16994]|uniref:Acetylornithine aminotransferase apoenzyme n=1 Tax=Sulfuricurvum kujiense (strain ATCC BAA-921 / DSM 16994 / JCM 11577 / YK-1) TaxID=709032 RepID=E4U3Y7_SULKY|nr:aspartate aminotransferase family protein [Sulfuricurvum kujiense]ADR35403.1 acetylornithine aminotransferase apoenzyme [Sulfuricurvum kujiense DSM 16994]